MRLNRVRAIAVALALALLALLALVSVRSAPALAADNPVTIMGAGDIAESGASTQANATATGDLIRAANPHAVFTLGDNAYASGTLSEYQTKYAPTWGSFKAKTHPTPGNHEYDMSPPGSGYRAYFGTANVTNPQDGGTYYAWNVGNGWRAYSLNSMIAMSAGSAQEKWLRSDLAAHPNMHYLAYLHYPRYNSGTIHGETPGECPLWNDLQAAGADIFMAGHDHSYERWAKTDCSKAAAAKGIREFKVGSGGNQLYPVGTRPSLLQARNNTDYGVLKLVLHENSYAWSFIASGRGWNGSTSVNTGRKGAVLDSGTQATNRTLSGTGGTPTPTKAPTPTATPTKPPTPTPTPTRSPAGSTLHYTANEGGSYTAPTALGYNLHDTGMSASTINALPAGTRAMVWAEHGKCPSSLTSTFQSFVTAQANNPKLYGYYLVDEPSNPSAACVAGIKAMADYIHAHAPGKKAFAVLTDYPGTYAAYAPSRSHLDLVGVDPYPCRLDAPTCNYADIDKQVTAAVAAGVPRSVIVPTFQLFGDSVWRAPTVTELRGILAEWQENVPSPRMDYSYSWGCQSGSLKACLSTRTDWQSVVRAYMSATPAPPPA